MFYCSISLDLSWKPRISKQCDIRPALIWYELQCDIVIDVKIQTWTLFFFRKTERHQAAMLQHNTLDYSQEFRLWLLMLFTIIGHGWYKEQTKKKSIRHLPETYWSADRRLNISTGRAHAQLSDLLLKLILDWARLPGAVRRPCANDFW